MSQSFGCKCEVKDKNNWVVLRRNYNNSYFESPRGGQHYSEYSSVKCINCGALGRTKAKYVVTLKDGDYDVW